MHKVPMEKGVNGSEPQEIEFRPVEESDFPTLTAWLAEPHVRRFYQKTPVTLEQVALEYGPFVRGEEPTINRHLTLSTAYSHLFAGYYLHDIGKQDVGFVAVWLNYRF
jgi:hypothetical protein